MIDNIPKKFRDKVITDKQQQDIEKAVRAFHPINKHVFYSTALPVDIINYIITPLAIPTVEILSLMQSLRGVPYGEGGETYKELLGSAARLVVNNPSFNFRAIQFTGYHGGEEKEFDLSVSFTEIYDTVSVTKDLVNKLLLEHCSSSFELFNKS